MSDISFNQETIIINTIINKLGKSYCEISTDLQTGYTSLKKLRRIAACIDMAESLEVNPYKTLVYDYISDRYGLSCRYVQDLPTTLPQYFDDYRCSEYFERSSGVVLLFVKYAKKNHETLNYDLCLDYTDTKIVNRMHACFLLRESSNKKLNSQLLTDISSKTGLSHSTIKHLRIGYPQHFLTVECR